MNDALVVVDVISAFAHEDGDRLLAAFRQRLDGFVRTLTGARRRAIPVIYVNDANGCWDGDAPSALRRALAGAGADVVSKVAPGEGESFLFKARYSAFDHTPLNLLLRELEVDRILLCGAATEGCVIQTGIDARELGFKVTIVSDACATIDAELERIALAYATSVGGIRVEASQACGLDRTE